MKHELTEQVLFQENECFANTAGISNNNNYLGLQPAYRDNATGDVYLSRFSNGQCAPVHLLSGLPDDIVTQRTPAGDICAIKGSVIPGFVRTGCFFTRAEAARIFVIAH